jgi:hypothetical protein
LRGFGAISLILASKMCERWIKKDKQVHAPADTDNEVHLRLGRDVKVAGGTSSTLETDLLLFLGKVALYVSLSTLEYDLALGLASLWSCERTCLRTNPGREKVQSRKMVD